MFVAAQWLDTIAPVALDGSTKRRRSVGARKGVHGGLRGAVKGWTARGGGGAPMAMGGGGSRVGCRRKGSGD